MLPCRLPGCELCLVSKVLDLSPEFIPSLLLVLAKAILKLSALVLPCLGEDSAWVLENCLRCLKRSFEKGSWQSQAVRGGSVQT